MSHLAPKRLRQRKGTRRQLPLLSFGPKSTFCLFLFAVFYGTSLLILQPMLHEDNAQSLNESLKHIPHVREGMKKMQYAKDRIMSKEKEIMERLRKRHSQLDHDVDNNNIKNIIEPPAKGHIPVEYNTKRYPDDNDFKDLEHQRIHTGQKPDEDVEWKNAFHNDIIKQPNNSYEKITVDNTKETGGFMVLGMHRSGTSMLGGLLVEGFGYHPGKPLIQPAYDNEKGFYELIPVVLQNDEFMDKQKVNWATNVKNFDAELALEHYKTNQVSFANGNQALRVLNDPNNIPYLQKDPRMCITMRTWLPLLNTKPAVIFTYRHPLEVAMSLQKRQGFALWRGLRLWIQYNKAAIINSADLCRVYSSNNALLADPLNETKRIAAELTSKCHVPAAPKMIDQDVVNNFVDNTLQHNKNKLKHRAEEKPVLETHHGNCVVKDFDSREIKGSAEQKLEMKTYLIAMKMYCDFESGDAYKDDYEWPAL